MSGFLYAIHFDSGLTKVGRAADPEARIAQHAERLAVAGLFICHQKVAACCGNDRKAEARLINLCTAAATERLKQEWFKGLLFEDVGKWVDECAATLTKPDVPFYRFRPRFTEAAHECDALIFCRACSVADPRERFDRSPYLCADCIARGYRAKVEKTRFRLYCGDAEVGVWSASDLTSPEFNGVACEETRPDLAWVRIYDPEWPIGRPLLDLLPHGA